MHSTLCVSSVSLGARTHWRAGKALAALDVWRRVARACAFATHKQIDRKGGPNASTNSLQLSTLRMRADELQGAGHFQAAAAAQQQQKKLRPTSDQKEKAAFNTTYASG